MTRARSNACTFGLSVSLLTLAACGGGSAAWVVPAPVAENVGPQLHIIGVVRYYDLEGGFYAIRGADNVTYDPRNLPAAFQKDGLRVEADVRRRDDVMGVHQVGPIIDLERIRAR
jgi:hypothetical protein